MNRSTQLKIVVVLAGGLALVAGVVAWWRMDEAGSMSRPHTVHTYAGTNYTVRLKELTVGRADAAHVILVSIRLDNTNAFPVVLNRSWFILVDANKDYYLPSTTGTQTPLITVPARGRLETEILSFTVPDDGLAGAIGLQVGQNYWIMIKENKPFDLKLKSGEFVTFHRRDW